MRSLVKENQDKKERIFYNPESFSSKVLELIEEIVGGTYIVFSRKTLMAKTKMYPPTEGYKIMKTLFKLEKNNFIKKTKDNKYQLTPKGIKRINFFKFFNLTFENRKRDDFWRVVIFDIPEKEKRKRELLRQKLREFDFYMIQKSVFISPFICDKEVEELCDILDLRDEVCVIMAKDLGKSEKLVKNFFSSVI